MLHTLMDAEGRQYLFETDIFTNNILPKLQVYNTQNSILREKVEDLLYSISTHYHTPQNVEQFTSFCLQLEILAENLNKNNIEKFKKEIAVLITNRQTFNILNVIDSCFNSNKKFNDVSHETWQADTHSRRGHNRIGEGEVFFSFFSGGSKPKKGDVYLEHITPLKVEFKGTKGRLLTSREIYTTDEFYEQFNIQEKSIHSMAIALCVLAGAIDMKDALLSLQNGRGLCSSYSDVCNAIVATNALYEYETLRERLRTSRYKKSEKSLLRSICGAIQLSLYRRESEFDWLILTKKETPYICKGFLLSSSILANTLTIINNDIIIHQNLDGKGYHISF